MAITFWPPIFAAASLHGGGVPEYATRKEVEPAESQQPPLQQQNQDLTGDREPRDEAFYWAFIQTHL